MLLDRIQLEADEEILVQTRRHWFIVVSQLFSLFVAAFVPLLLLWLAPFLTNQLVEFDLSQYWNPAIFVYCLWLLFLWYGIFSIWTNYYLDVLTVTDRRIIMINQKGFFWRNNSSFRHERLQDINVEVNGILATLLDFGDIRAETAGAGPEELYATGLPKPRDIKTTILTASDKRIDDYKNSNESV